MVGEEQHIAAHILLFDQLFLLLGTFSCFTVPVGLEIAQGTQCQPQKAGQGQRYTYRVLQTIQLKLILLCVWAELAVLGIAKTALKFTCEI